MAFNRIAADPRQMDGVPCVRGLRIPVATIVTLVADGHSTREILTLYSDLEEEDVREALHFAAAVHSERTGNSFGPNGLAIGSSRQTSSSK